jgi:translocation and assembly module TamB
VTNRQRRLLISLSVLALAFVLVVLALHSELVLRWSFARLATQMQGELTAESIEGNLLGPIRIKGLRYSDQSVKLRLGYAYADWNPAELLAGRVQISSLVIQDLDIHVLEGQDTSSGDTSWLPAAFFLIPVELKSGRLDHLSVSVIDQTSPFTLNYVGVSASARHDQLQLNTLHIIEPEYALDAEGIIWLRDAFPVDLRIAGALGLSGIEPLRAVADVQGDLDALKVDARLEQPGGAHLQGSVNDLLGDLRWQGELELAALNLSQISKSLPAWSLDGQGQLSGTLSEVSLKGAFSSVLPKLDRVSADVALDLKGSQLSIQRAEITQASTQARVQIEGDLKQEGGQFVFDARSKWQDVQWPLAPDDVLQSDRGAAKISGSLASYRVELKDAHLQYHQYEAQGIMASGTGNSESLDVDTLQAQLLKGEASATGRLDWKDGLKWKADLKGKTLDAAVLWPDWPTSIDVNMSSDGRFRAGKVRAGIDVRSLGGRLRANKIIASGKAEYLPGGAYHVEKLDVLLGKSHIQLNGTVDQNWDLDWQLANGDVSLLDPNAKGMVNSSGHLSGPRDRPVIRGSLSAKDLSRGEVRLGQSLRSLEADLNVDLGGVQQSSLSLQADELKLQGQSFDKLQLNAQGNAASNNAKLQVTAKDESLNLALHGRIKERQWLGQIDRADIRSSVAGDWTLAAAVPVTASEDKVAMQTACWHQQKAVFCADLTAGRDLEWQTHLSLEQAPLNLLHALFSPEIQFQGVVSGKAELGAKANQIHDARVDMDLGSGAIRYVDDKNDYPVISFRSATLHVLHSCQAFQAGLKVDLENQEALSGSFELPELGCNWAEASVSSRSIRGRVDINTRQLGILRMFYPGLGELSGELDAHMKMSGTVGDPQIAGLAELKNGLAEIPVLGITLKDMKLQLSKSGGRYLQLGGTASSGGNTLKLDGRMQLAPELGWPSTLAISGHDFQVADLKDIKAWVSPDLKISMKGRRIDVTGKVHIPRVEMKAFTPPESVLISNDVVFVGDDESKGEARRASPWQVYSDVRLTFGDDVNFEGYGLRGKLAGDLRVTDEPGRGSIGQGALHIREGKFRAYGVSLDVDIGRIIFAGGPVGDPDINARASRRSGDTTVGVNVQGRLKAPQITVFSTPYLPESEAMSLLLFGKVRPGYSTGLSGATDESSGAGVDLGNLLSPGYYVDYLVGALNPGSVMRIRYELTRNIEIRAESSSTYQAGDIIYSIER